MEVTKDLRKNCSSVVATLNQNNADYTVRLNRESKHNRGLLRANSQVRIANRLGDVLGTNAKRLARLRRRAGKVRDIDVFTDFASHGPA